MKKMCSVWRGGVLKYSILLVGFYLCLFFVSCSNDVAECDDVSPELYVSDEGFKYTKSSRSISVYGLDDDNDRVNLVIPSTIAGLPVKEIADYAFRDEKAITSIQFPENLEKIGKEAFYNCESLSTVTFPSKLKVIGEKAFAECISLTDVTLNQGLEILDYAFQYSNVKAVTIPSSVKSMKWAFCRCENLSQVTLTSGLTEISECAFAGTAITSISLPDTVVSIGDGALSDTQISSISFPKNINYIGEGSLARTKITSVQWPATVSEIKDFTFYGTALEEFTFAEGAIITSIGSRAFAWEDTYKEYMGPKFTSFTVPEGVKYLGKGVFHGSNIENLVLPETLETIEDCAFGCMKIKELRIPSSVKKIGSNILDSDRYGDSYTKLNKLVIACNLTDDVLKEGSVYQNGIPIYVYGTKKDTSDEYEGVEVIFEDNVKIVSGEIIKGFFSSVDFGNNITVKDFELGNAYDMGNQVPVEEWIFDNPTCKFENCTFVARTIKFNEDCYLRDCKFTAVNLQINVDCTKMRDCKVYGNLKEYYDDEYHDIPCEVTVKNGVTFVPWVDGEVRYLVFNSIRISKIDFPNTLQNNIEYKPIGFGDCTFINDFTIDETNNCMLFEDCEFEKALKLSAPCYGYNTKAKKIILDTSLQMFWRCFITEDFEMTSNVTRWYGGIKITKPMELDFSNITYIESTNYLYYYGAVEYAHNEQTISKVTFSSNTTIIDDNGPCFYNFSNTRFIFNGPLMLTSKAKNCFKNCSLITQKPTIIGEEPSGAFSGTGIN